MSDRVSQFLESDLLERYLMGTTSPMESQEVEYFVAKFPEVKTTYNELQENLENYAASYAVDVPKDLRAKILKQTKAKPKRALPLLAIAACTIATLFGLVAIMIYNQNKNNKYSKREKSNI